MKIFIFLVGIGWNWGILGSNDLMNWWDINPPFMYCVFNHISDHLQRLILFWQFYKKVGLRSDPPPPGWSKRPSLSKDFFWGSPNGLTGVEDGIMEAPQVNSAIQCTMCKQSCACTDARSTQMRVSDALRGSGRGHRLVCRWHRRGHGIAGQWGSLCRRPTHILPRITAITRCTMVRRSGWWWCYAGSIHRTQVMVTDRASWGAGVSRISRTLSQCDKQMSAI